MTNTSKTIFALLAVLGGLASASQAQAATSTVMLSANTFADHCAEQGGDFGGLEDGYSCELETARIDCLFEGVYGYCQWEGGPNKREVLGVIGMAVADSLSEPVFKKKITLQLNPVPPVVQFP